MSKYVPILFSGDMVRAILQGRKTQTRRLIKSMPARIYWNQIVVNSYGGWVDDHGKPCKPKCEPGDILYVRETWGVGTRPCPYNGSISGIEYRADEPLLEGSENLRINPIEGIDHEKYEGRGWMPSIHMPKVACRIFLQATRIWPERLNDISQEDCIAEGIERHTPVPGDFPHGTVYKDYLSGTMTLRDPKESYKSLWEKINGAGSWDKNPAVWCYEFEVLDIPNPFV